MKLNKFIQIPTLHLSWKINKKEPNILETFDATSSPSYKNKGVPFSHFFNSSSSMPILTNLFSFLPIHLYDSFAQHHISNSHAIAYCGCFLYSSTLFFGGYVFTFWLARLLICVLATFIVSFPWTFSPKSCCFCQLKNVWILWVPWSPLNVSTLRFWKKTI